MTIELTYFLWGFAGTILVFWLLPLKVRFGFLAAVSAAYIATQEPQGVAVLGGMTWLVYKSTAQNSWGARFRWTPSLLIAGLLAYLFYFKYLPDALSLNVALDQKNLAPRAIPLGISYFTFKLIHFIVECRRGLWSDVDPQRFFCYIFLYPIFTAGPIERFDHFRDNLQTQFSINDFSEGVLRIIHGCIKKFIIAYLISRELGQADLLQVYANNLDSTPATDLWIFAFLNYLYVYFDFSAYSDLAIGASRLFGIKIGENFNFPLISVNIVDFWQRWHISLRAWCQSYIYLPVIAITRKPYLAIYLTFITMGLWHAGSASYLIWGLYHATGVAIFQRWRKSKLSSLPGEAESLSRVVFGGVVTNLFISVSHILSVGSNAGWYDRIMVIIRMFNPFALLQ